MAGHIVIIRLLLDRRANINTKNKIENTPLTSALLNNYTIIIKLLLKRGADIYIKNSIKKTALDRAKEKDYIKVIRILKASRTGFFKP